MIPALNAAITNRLVHTSWVAVLGAMAFVAVAGCSGQSGESAPPVSADPDGARTTSLDDRSGRESELAAVELEVVEGSALFCETFVNSIALRRLPDALSGLSEDDGLRARAVGEATEALEVLAEAPGADGNDVDARVPDGVAMAAGDAAAALRFLLEDLENLDKVDSSSAGIDVHYLKRSVVDDVMSALADLGWEVDRHCVFVES